MLLYCGKLVDLGSAPYDALPQVIASKLPKIPFAAVRIVYDVLITVIGLICSGAVGVFTVAACFFLGPVIAAIAAKFKPWFG